MKKQPEQSFQISLVRDLRYLLTPNTFMTHFPAGGGGGMRGVFLKAAGLIAGCPDLLLIHQGCAYWLELKVGKNKLTPAQIACHRALKAAGSSVETVRNLDEALECLALWGVPTRIKHGPWITARPLKTTPHQQRAE